MTSLFAGIVPNSIVIAGHSHARALVGRIECETIELRPLPDQTRVYDYCGPWPRSQEYWDTLAGAPHDSTIVLLWCGNEHNAHFMFKPTPMFDFFISSDPGNRPTDGLLLLPERQVRHRLSMFMGDLEKVLTSLRDRSSARVVVLGSPPPKGDIDRLRSLIASEWYFRERAKQLGVDLSELEISPAWLRLKLWKLLQQMYREQCERSGATFLPVPRDVSDDAGFLLQRYWDDDATHANAEYGNRLVNYLSERL